MKWIEDIDGVVINVDYIERFQVDKDEENEDYFAVYAVTNNDEYYLLYRETSEVMAHNYLSSLKGKLNAPRT